MQRDVQLFRTFPLKMTRKESCLCLKGKYYLKSTENVVRGPPLSPHQNPLLQGNEPSLIGGRAKMCLKWGKKETRGVDSEQQD